MFLGLLFCFTVHYSCVMFCILYYAIGVILNLSLASLSDTKGMSIDCVLRSSSRYKKAKIIASQLDESESQPDFVPDSFADM